MSGNEQLNKLGMTDEALYKVAMESLHRYQKRTGNGGSEIGAIAHQFEVRGYSIDDSYVEAVTVLKRLESKRGVE